MDTGISISRAWYLYLKSRIYHYCYKILIIIMGNTGASRAVGAATVRAFQEHLWKNMFLPEAPLVGGPGHVPHRPALWLIRHCIGEVYLGAYQHLKACPRTLLLGASHNNNKLCHTVASNPHIDILILPFAYVYATSLHENIDLQSIFATRNFRHQLM